MSETHEKKIRLSCVDCAVTACRYGTDNYPAFCLTKPLTQERKDAVLKKYFTDDFISKCSICSVEVEGEYYGEMARVEETMEFARRIGAKKLGLAYCCEMESEAELYKHILEINGFEVVAVGCRENESAEGVTSDSDCDPHCDTVDQAGRMNAEKTDFNILMGLCVGCDALFLKHSDALSTVMINKDRLTANNPVFTLYRPQRRKLL